MIPPPVQGFLLSLFSEHSLYRYTSEVGGARTGVDALLATHDPMSASNELFSETAACPPHLWTLNIVAKVQPHNLVRALPFLLPFLFCTC